MTLREFADLIKDMRAAQTKYLRSGSVPSLALSARLEREVDAAVKEILEPDLFQGEEDTR